MDVKTARNYFAKEPGNYGPGLDKRLERLGIRPTTAPRRKPTSSTIGAAPSVTPSPTSPHLTFTTIGGISQ